jgi:hypothetical protein
MTHAVRIASPLLLTWALATPLAAQPNVEKAAREDIAKLLSAISYGVPTSPAFALLPGDASEVTHIVRPSELQGQAASWFTGTRLRGGAALDYRLFGTGVGDLKQYRDPRLAGAARRVAWHTILSAGTAKSERRPEDVALALGLRLPLVDRGDPRLDTKYLSDVRAILSKALNACGVAFPEETVDEAEARCLRKEQPQIKKRQEEFKVQHWNAFRIDLGVAGSTLARGGEMKPDSLAGDRGGLWLGLGGGIGQRAAFAIVGKSSWARADTATDEQARHVAGARLRFFPGLSVGLSVEGAQVWSRTAGGNDDWTHLAAVVELPLDRLGGVFKQQWLSVGYGGDAGKSGGSKNALTLRYAVYRDQLISR